MFFSWEQFLSFLIDLFSCVFVCVGGGGGGGGGGRARGEVGAV